MKTATTTLATVLLSISLALAQKAPVNAPTSEAHMSGQPQTFPLWENGATGALGTADEDIPTVTVYLPPHPNFSATAVIVAPGGGYVALAINHEGRQIANWLNSLGLTAFVLKYRLAPKYRHPVELHDGQRAMRWVRARAQQYGYSPDRIGMMGFSAGGHLAATVGTHYDHGDQAATDPIDRVSCRPDFLILAYPVISFVAPYSHSASARHLLGDNPDMKLREDLSDDLQVTQDTPPAFLFSTTTDKVVPPENSVAFYLALHSAGVSAELHIFQKGSHGVGLDLADPYLGVWPTLLADWLRQRGLLAK